MTIGVEVFVTIYQKNLKRYEMKTYFLFLILFTYVSLLFAQETEKTISIIPALGDTINKAERDFYKLFPNVEDFKYAVFDVGENQTITANVCSQVNGKLEYHIYKNYMAGLQNINRYLEQVDKVSASTSSGQEIIVYKTDSTEIKGELICIRQYSILIFPMQDGISLIDDNDLITVISKESIHKIMISNPRNIFGNCLVSSYTGGAILGLLTGAIASIASKNKSEQNFAPALVALIGWAIGTVITYFIISDDTEYNMVGEYDFSELNENARFINFVPLYLKNIK